MIWHNILRTKNRKTLSQEDWEALQAFAKKVLQIDFVGTSEKEIIQTLFADRRAHQKQIAAEKEAIGYISDVLAEAHHAIVKGNTKSIDGHFTKQGTHLKQGVFRREKRLGMPQRARKRIRKIAEQKHGEQVPVDDNVTVTIPMKDQIETAIKEELVHKKLRKTITSSKKA